MKKMFFKKNSCIFQCKTPNPNFNPTRWPCTWEMILSNHFIYIPMQNVYPLLWAHPRGILFEQFRIYTMPGRFHIWFFARPAALEIFWWPYFCLFLTISFWKIDDPWSEKLNFLLRKNTLRHVWLKSKNGQRVTRNVHLSF